MDLSINVPMYGELPHVDAAPSVFFRQTTVLYGPSKTGKTVIGKWILNILKPYIPNVIVICPTADSNNDYADIIPDRCIFRTITVEKIREVWQRQQEASKLWSKANNLKTMVAVLLAGNDRKHIDKYNRLQNFVKTKFAELERSKMPASKIKELKKNTTKKMEEVTRRICKSAFRNGCFKSRLNDEEAQIVVKYVNFNPSLLLILDDCQAEIGKWGKDETINLLFFQGRHEWVTSIYMMQGDSGKNGLPPEIRLNAFNNFFTDRTTATRFFKNTSNSFTHEDIRDAEKVINTIFKQEAGVDNYKKMYYSRLDPVAKFRYVIADEPDDMKFGSQYLWELCKKIPTEKTSLKHAKFIKI